MVLTLHRHFLKIRALSHPAAFFFSTTPPASATSNPYRYKELRGNVIAREVFDSVRKEAIELASAGFAPRLLSVSIGNEKASQLYIKNQKRIAEKCHIDFQELILPANTSRSELLATIAARNADPRVTGIIVQRPIPPSLDIKEVQQAVHPLKDVEGMHPASLGQLVYNEADLAPCTAKAAVELLKQTGLTLPGLQVVVVGHSEIVGKPISFLLLSEGCTVTVCHHLTRNLGQHTRQADALFVAVGKAGLVTGDMIKPGAAVIDVGINQVLDKNSNGSKPGSKPVGKSFVGDVNYETALPVAGWITPVPGGVGTVTTAMLMNNIVVAAQRQQKHYRAGFGPHHTSTNVAMMST